MIGKPRYTLLLSIVAAIIFWLADSIVDYVVHYDEPFFNVLILNKTENSFRILASAGFLFFGAIMSKVLSRQQRAEEALRGEITERKEAEKRLLALSVRDELTGLYNRRGFFALAEQQLKLSQRSRNSIYIFYADLDNLKTINDDFGHQEGDSALVEIARILEDTFRESDIIARIGGDEFVAIPVGTTGETLEIISSRFARNIELHNAERQRGYAISASVGIACYNPGSPYTIDELLAEGDRLMYEDKRKKLHHKRYS